MHTIILIVIIPVLLAIFFIFSLYFFPHFYLATRHASQPLPKIINVNVNTSSSALSDSGISHLGESFVVTITSANLGDTTDFQIASISFPNITSDIHDNIANKIVSILHHNFTQSPVFISIGDEIGSEYTGLTKTTAKYPSIEFYNSPWATNTLYEAQLQIKPVSEGNFVVFVKVVALPHTTDLSHYPAVGIRDQQQEYVNVYHIAVVK
jgi:hypothetical protein